MTQKSIGGRLSGEKGYIVMDIAVAIVIISVALLPISAMFTQALQMNTVANQYLMATNLAQKQLELLKIYPVSYWSTLTVPCSILWQDERELPPAKYKVTTNAVVSIIDTNLVEVSVTVDWNERGKEYYLKFVTLYPMI